MVNLSQAYLADIAARTIEEDCGGTGDATTSAVIPQEAYAEGSIVARTECVCAGMPVVEAIYQHLDEEVSISRLVQEGAVCRTGEKIASVQGNARSMLTGERSALNFLQRLSGIATLTRKYVDIVGDAGPKILDTRKTTPLLRRLEKYAVRCGGGVNHRLGLYDRIMIKDNHRSIGGYEDVNGIKEAVERCRSLYPDLEIEVEADTLSQAEAAAEAGAEYVLLDNMSPEDLEEAVKVCGGKSLLEASGSVDLASVEHIRETGVDFISVGALTHSASAADINLELNTTS